MSKKKKKHKVTYVFSAFCTWWDNIHETSMMDTGTLCCPHCGSYLYETGVMDEWLEYARRKATHSKSFAAYFAWSQGKCFLTVTGAMEAFAAERHEQGEFELVQ